MKNILITPLDWGLGHATRCIPIINRLLSRGCNVMIGGSGNSLDLLKKEFPSLKFFQFPGYDPEYPSSGSMVWKMALQLPRFIRVIRQEHRLVQDIIKTHQIQILISDNRYGCWSDKILSIFITHQSNILMPRRFGWLAGLVRRANERQMKKFSCCWIPDFPDKGLAGDLVSFGKFNRNIPVEYIGNLSRFSTSGKTCKKYDIAAIFSGPEPQRSIFENILLPQLKNSGLSWFAVRGLPSSVAKEDTNIVNFMNGNQLSELIECSDLVIARSGYSTVMDLMALQKRAIFIPSPGQTEQEYLADRLLKRKIAFSMAQHKFNLNEALENARDYEGFKGFMPNDALLEKAIDKILQPKV